MLVALALICGATLVIGGLFFRIIDTAATRPRAALVDAIDTLLPQTQCGQCGYAGCRPYAQAIAEGRIGIDQCPPGGIATLRRLGQLLNRDISGLTPKTGIDTANAVALIEEASCIGCTLCIQACPVDAILGAAKQMHTVLAGHCTGCELCLPVCPVDCILMLPVKRAPPSYVWPLPVEERRAA
jgi:Na+-translocating ferredoxin:NAD+ oxidoreductase subunit B